MIMWLIIVLLAGLIGFLLWANESRPERKDDK